MIHHDTTEMNVLFVHSALDDYPLSTEEFRIYAHLARRAKDGKAWPGAKSVSIACRINLATAKDGLRRLEAYGLIRIEDRGAQGKTNVYHLLPFSKWKPIAEVLTLQAGFTEEGRSKRAAKRAERTQTPLPDATPLKGDPTPRLPPPSFHPPLNEGEGTPPQTREGEGGQTRGTEGNPSGSPFQEETTRERPGITEAGKSNAARAPQDQSAQREPSIGAGRAGAADAAQTSPTVAPPQGSPDQEAPAGRPTSSEQVPAGAPAPVENPVENSGAARVRSMFGRRMLDELLGEMPERARWSELPTDQLETLRRKSVLAQDEHHGTKWRTHLIGFLDAAVVQLDKPKGKTVRDARREANAEVDAILSGGRS